MIIGGGLFLLYVIPGLLEAIVGSLGEDVTFTGRTDLWKDLLSQPINPLMGTGYQSFWLGERAEIFWEKYYFHPNQAHNGYIETYLNGGFLGVACLAGLLIAAAATVKRDVIRGVDFARVRFAALIIALFYNWTEAVFNRLSLVWFILLIAAVNMPRRTPVKVANPSAKTPGRSAVSDPRQSSPI